MTIPLTDRARSRLEQYLAEVHAAVARGGDADAGDVVAGIREHVEAELAVAAHEGPVTAEAIERVLERLGSPERWHDTGAAGTAPPAARASHPSGPSLSVAALAAFGMAIVGALLTAFGWPVPGLTLVALGALAARAALEGDPPAEGSAAGLLRTYWTAAVFALVALVALAPAALVWGSAQIGGALDHWANPGAPPVPGTRRRGYWWGVIGAALAASAFWSAALAMLAFRWPHVVNRLLGPAPFRLTRRFAIVFALPLITALGAAGCEPVPADRPETAPEAALPPVAQRIAAVDSAHLTAIDSVRALLRPLAREGVAIAVAVHRGDRAIWVEGLGYAGPDERRVADPRATLFRVYSLSKPLTAVAGARLMEAGALDPDAPVQRDVPAFPVKDRPVTIMGLATHRAGIRHYRGGEAQSLRRCERPADALPLFMDDPLVTAGAGPGEHYSSWGFVLLSAALEGAAGEPFTDVVRRQVLDPAGMSATRLDDGSAPGPDQAAPLTEADDGTAPADPVDNGCKFGAGAYLASAHDMARFGVAMVDGTLLSPRSLQLFLQGGDRYQAQGIGVGGTAFLLAHEPSATAIALLANVSGESLGPALQRAFEVLVAAFAD